MGPPSASFKSLGSGVQSHGDPHGREPCSPTIAMAVAGSVAIVIAILAALGTEARGIIYAKAKTVVS
jgi:hypothetical protein